MTAYRHRLYIQETDGWRKGDLPEILLSGNSVAACDFDQDGDLDLFVGGRIVPQSYPDNPGSYLLVNDSGKFTMQQPAGLADSGMVTDAVWADLDGNGWDDLAVAIEWGSPRIWSNDRGALTETTAEAGLADKAGWWMSLGVGDFDGDGDLDLLGGNWGLNSKYKASPEHPVSLYAGDFGDGGVHLVEACTQAGHSRARAWLELLVARHAVYQAEVRHLPQVRLRLTRRVVHSQTAGPG